MPFWFSNENLGSTPLAFSKRHCIFLSLESHSGIRHSILKKPPGKQGVLSQDFHLKTEKIYSSLKMSVSRIVISFSD